MPLSSSVRVRNLLFFMGHWWNSIILALQASVSGANPGCVHYADVAKLDCSCLVSSLKWVRISPLAFCQSGQVVRLVAATHWASVQFRPLTLRGTSVVVNISGSNPEEVSASLAYPIYRCVAKWSKAGDLRSLLQGSSGVRIFSHLFIRVFLSSQRGRA